MELRADLPPMPVRMKALPRDHRGFPIPWFVAELPNGERDFRIADPRKRHRAITQNLCWVCGGIMGAYKAFVIGPMCAVNRVTSEPPCHLECAQFSAMGCPFLTRPKMRRNDKGLEEIDTRDPSGVFLTRNPGCTCIWVTRSYQPFQAGETKEEWLIRLDEPTDVYWYAFGKTATREQVLEAMDSGMPLLQEMAHKESPKAEEMLKKYRQRVNHYLPKGVEDAKQESP